MSAIRRASLLVICLIIILAAGQAAADWLEPRAAAPYCSSEMAGACTPPVNQGVAAQIKEGGLFIGIPPAAFANLTHKFEVSATSTDPAPGLVIGQVTGTLPSMGKKLIVNFFPLADLDVNSLVSQSEELDVRYQVKIRGGNPAPGKVLKAVETSPGVSDGLAEWGDDGVLSITTGNGLIWNPVDQTLVIDFINWVQKKIDYTWTPTNRSSAIAGVTSNPGGADDGRAIFKNFVYDFTSTGGILKVGNSSGNLFLSGDVAGEFNTSGNAFNLDEPPAGTGLMFATSTLAGLTPPTGQELRLDTRNGPCDTTRPYLQWNGSSWLCVPPPPVSTTNKPASNILYLKRRNGEGNPPNCPTGWNLLGTSVETASTTASEYHNIRVCQRSTAGGVTNPLCQVLYLKSNVSAPLCSSYPACPTGSGWTSVDTAPEWAAGQVNCARTCTYCQALPA